MEFTQAVRDQRCDIIDDMLSKGHNPTDEDISTAIDQVDIQLNIVTKLLPYSTDLNLHLKQAVTHGHVCLLDHLFLAGVNLNYRYPNGKNILHYSNTPETCQWLLSMGVTCEQDSDGETPLHRAARYKKIELIKVLLDHGAQQIPDNYGLTPMHRGALWYDIEAIHLLIQHGGKQTLSNRNEYPLYDVCSHPHDDITLVSLLINQKLSELGLDQELFQEQIQEFTQEQKEFLEYINQANKDGTTPLHLACLYGNNLIADVLLKHGAQDISDGVSIGREIAIQDNNKELIEIFEKYDIPSLNHKV